MALGVAIAFTPPLVAEQLPAAPESESEVCVPVGVGADERDVAPEGVAVGSGSSEALEAAFLACDRQVGAVDVVGAGP